MMPRERKRAALYIALIFFCGFVSGTLVTNIWTQWGPTVSAQGDSNRSSRRERTVERFTRELSLSPDQAAQLNQILAETRQSYRTSESEVRQQGRDRIRQILTPEQRARYEETLTNNDRKRKRRK